MMADNRHTVCPMKSAHSFLFFPVMWFNYPFLVDSLNLTAYIFQDYYQLSNPTGYG